MEIVPDSGLAVLKSASGLEILDLESGERVHSPEPTGYGSALALTRDGKSALANAAPGSFASWNLAGQRVCSFGPHDCGVVAVACTPDGKHAVSGSSEGTVKVWDLSRGSETPKRAAHRIHLTGLLLGDAGRRALLATGTTVELWDAERCQRIGLLPSSGFTHALALCPSGNRALSSGDALQLWDLRTGELLRTFGEGSGVSCMAFSPDGQHLVAATGESEELTIWDLERGALMRKAAFERVCYQVSSLAISANGRLAVTACNDDGPCLVWDLVHLRVVREYDMHVNALALAPDGLHALHASWNGLHEFNLATGAIRRSFLGHTAAVVDVALSRDGERAGSVSFDKTVRLWSSSGEPLATFSADQGLARVAIDGDRVVAADQSGQLHILDV
jgi:WD40 repeat protein